MEKQITLKQRRQVDAALDQLVAEAQAEAFQWPTIKSYRMWVRRFSWWLILHGQEFREAGPAVKIRAYLLFAAAGHDNGKRKSATTLDQARHALLFFYQKVRREEVENIGSIPVAHRPELLPEVPTPDQVARVLAAVEDTPASPYRLIFRLLYYTGARINDVLRLRLKDIDWRDSQVVFRCGKGKKDGRGVLPCGVMTDLREQALRAYHLWKIDRAAGVPAELPDAVYNKCPRYGLAWGWYFLFPAAGMGINPLQQIRNRWHVDARHVQRAMRKAAQQVGLEGIIRPHALRHVYATELLRDGVDVRTVQALLRHADVKTTEIYTHTAMQAPGTRAAIERHAQRLEGVAA